MVLEKFLITAKPCTNIVDSARLKLSSTIEKNLVLE